MVNWKLSILIVEWFGEVLDLKYNKCNLFNCVLIDMWYVVVGRFLLYVFCSKGNVFSGSKEEVSFLFIKSNRI